MSDFKRTIIILGHGSRVPGAGNNMQLVADGLQTLCGYDSVKVCNMSRLGPHFPEIFKQCVDQGATEVLVMPYFLHDGLHLRLDIPEMLQEAAREYPQVKLILGSNLGYDEALVHLLAKRIEASMDCPDVRSLTLLPRNHFPVPPGQCEFVPMPPQDAAQYFKEEGHEHSHSHGH